MALTLARISQRKGKNSDIEVFSTPIYNAISTLLIAEPPSCVDPTDDGTNAIVKVHAKNGNEPVIHELILARQLDEFLTDLNAVEPCIMVSVTNRSGKNLDPEVFSSPIKLIIFTEMLAGLPESTDPEDEETPAIIRVYAHRGNDQIIHTLTLSEDLDEIIAAINAAEAVAISDPAKENVSNKVGTVAASATEYPNNDAIIAYVGTALADLVDSAPGVLDTLNEISEALADDPNFATTMTNLLALKAPLTGASFVDSPLVPSPVAADNSQKAAPTTWVKQAITLSAMHIPIGIVTGFIDNSIVAGTYIVGTLAGSFLPATGAADAPAVWDINNLTNLAGVARTGRLVVTALTNATDPGADLTFDIRPIASVAGAAGIEYTLGAALAGSSSGALDYGASEHNTFDSGAIALAAGTYVACVTVGAGGLAAGARVHLNYQLQIQA